MLRISVTAFVACRTSGNWAIATVVGNSGARRIVTECYELAADICYVFIFITLCDDAECSFSTWMTQLATDNEKVLTKPITDEKLGGVESSRRFSRPTRADFSG